MSPVRSRGGREAGAEFELAAEHYLGTQGLQLLQRNFSSRFGEIDLVMLDGADIVFVEVRYRRNAKHGSGAASVTRRKQHRLSMAAAWYLAKFPRLAMRKCRFDVVSNAPGPSGQGVNWIKNAFYSTIG
jgi:putative endonuclease